MAKERSVNPVQAQRKADKAKAIKKGKATVATQRNERLAKRNPERIQTQIDDLKAITASGGKLSRHEEQTLEGLEKEIKAVTKARATLGDNAPIFSRGPRRDGGSFDGGRSSVLGKRGRGDDDILTSDEDVPEDVQRIPMPRDTPPPIPKEIMDKWHTRRRERWAERNRNANMEPLGDNARMQGRDGGSGASIAEAPPKVQIKTVYEAMPIVRDLRKEAAAFVPAVVRMKLDKVQGKGGLIEPDEADRLEQEGYLKPTLPLQDDVDVPAIKSTATAQEVTVEDVEDEGT